MAKKTYKLVKPKAGEWTPTGVFMTRTAFTRLADTGENPKDFVSFTSYKPTDKSTLKDVITLLGGEKRAVRLAIAGFNNKTQFNLRQGDKTRSKIAEKAGEAFGGVSISSDDLAEALRDLQAKRAAKK